MKRQRRATRAFAEAEARKAKAKAKSKAALKRLMANAMQDPSR